MSIISQQNGSISAFDLFMWHNMTWLSGWWFQPISKMLVSWDYHSQCMEKHVENHQPVIFSNLFFSHSFSLVSSNFQKGEAAKRPMPAARHRVMQGHEAMPKDRTSLSRRNGHWRRTKPSMVEIDMVIEMLSKLVVLMGLMGKSIMSIDPKRVLSWIYTQHWWFWRQNNGM